MMTQQTASRPTTGSSGPNQPKTDQGISVIVLTVVLLVAATVVSGGLGVIPGLSGVSLADIIANAQQSLGDAAKVPVTTPGTKPKVKIPTGNSIAARGMALVASGKISATTGAGCDPLKDLKSGKMYHQDIDYLDIMTKAGFTLRLSCVHTGHSTYVHNSTNVSLHTVWQAYDIDRINGDPVCEHYNSGGWCTQTSDGSKKLIAWLRSRSNAQLPFEVGSPFSVGSRGKSSGPHGTRGGPFFTNLDHQNHFHFGFKGPDGRYPSGSWWTS